MLDKFLARPSPRHLGKVPVCVMISFSPTEFITDIFGWQVWQAVRVPQDQFGIGIPTVQVSFF